MAARSNRTRPLVVIAFVLLAINVAFLLTRSQQQEWLIRLPALEEFQRQHPDNLLFSSDHWDARVPISSVIDPSLSEERPSMLRDILSCRPTRVVMETREKLPQMPVRYYVSGIGGREYSDCVRSKLPPGYVIESA
jgi:hypothetical protein